MYQKGLLKMKKNITPIITFKNCKITNIKIDKLDIEIFNGTFADRNLVDYPKITIQLLNQPEIIIEPTTDGYYRDVYGFTKPGQILMSIIQFVAENNPKQLLISKLIQHIIKNCEHDGCLNIRIGKNNKKLILPYTGLPYDIDYRFPIIQEFFDDDFDKVYMNNVDITSTINFDPSPNHQSDILNHHKLLIANEPNNQKLTVYEDEWSIIDTLIKL